MVGFGSQDGGLLTQDGGFCCPSVWVFGVSCFARVYFMPKAHPLFDKPKKKSDLAEWLGCSERFIDEEVALGRLPARRLTVRLTVFLPHDVECWLETKRKLAQLEAVK
jgi:hypothetical protein